MIIGQTLQRGVTAYSPWFPRDGDAATFVLECIGASGATLTVNVMHKNYGDVDFPPDQVAGSFNGVSSAGTHTKRLSNLKELIRFEYGVTGTNNYDWIHFRMLQPTWERNGSGGAPTGVMGAMGQKSLQEATQRRT